MDSTDDSTRYMSHFQNKLAIGTQILDRTLELTRHCDAKASICLSAALVIITLIADKFDAIHAISKLLENGTTISTVMFVIAVISTVVLIIGIGLLLNVLVPRISIQVASDPTEININKQILFFSAISKNKFLEYRTLFNDISDDDLLMDLLAEIHINSIIAKIKYSRFNLGIKLVSISLFTITVILIVC